MCEDILFPADRDQAAREAAVHAFKKAEEHSARLHVLYVINETEATAILGQGKQKFNQLQEEAQGITEELAVEAGNRDLEVREETRRGKPAREILAYVEDEDIDLLVMSMRGRSGVGRFLLGSTTEKVLRQSEVPSFVIPQ